MLICLKLEINEFRCNEAKIEESEKGRQPPGVEPRTTSGLSRQRSATEPRQPANHQPSQSSICTAQVVLNASVAHLTATQYVPSETLLGVDRKILSIKKEPMLSGFLIGRALVTQPRVLVAFPLSSTVFASLHLNSFETYCTRYT